MKTMGELLERNAVYYPDQLAVVHGDRRDSYSLHFTRSSQVADALCRLGVRRQDRVSILAMNRCEYLEVMHACYIAGFIAATVNFRLAIPEYRFILEDSSPQVLFFESQYTGAVEALRSALQSIEHYVCIDGEGPEWALAYEELLASGDPQGPPIRARADDAANLIYTSGTTGRPKGVVHGHACELSQAQEMSMVLDIRSDSRILEVMPYFHVGAQSSATGAMWRGGAVFLHRNFDPVAVLEAVEREKITTLHLVPLMVQALIDVPEIERHDVSSLDTILYAAAPMPVPVLRRALKIFGPVFTNSWGQTEGTGTSLPKHMHRPDGSPEEVRLLGSIGQMRQGGELRIVDENDRDCEVGQPGELILRATSMMTGYWNNTAATLEALRDGWLRTGDMGYFDERRNVFLVDRKKDMIISGGENIYSLEVEQALAEHPAVAQVAVIGVPDEKWGESVKAIIVTRANTSVTPDELGQHCIQLIASYKRPRAYEFASELPVMPSGKIDKKALRELYGR
jgi:acyl-CoA synthetase (AMP-forming)/AMP-acid ligase II